MSVDASIPSAGPKAVAASDSRNGVGKAKAGANQSAGDAAPGGFSALLTSFETPDVLASLPRDSAGDLPGEDASGLGVPSLVPGNTLVNEVPWSELSLLLGQKMPADFAIPAVDASDSGEVGAISTLVSLLGGEKLPSLVLPETGESVPTDSVTMSAMLGGVSKAAAKPVVSVDALPSSEVIESTPLKSSIDGFTSDLVRQGLAVPSRKSGTNDLQSLIAANLAESRSLKPTAFMDLVAKEPALSAALVAMGQSSDLINSTVRSAAPPISGVATTGLEGSFAQHALTPGSASDAASAVAGAALTPESAVAEQVTYWVSQGIQNAQLKLEGFGSEPVEVSISLKGQEAQIDFRTDQPEIRQMLEGALVQLKETLLREGLVLSGVSVGASGQQGGGAQDRRQQTNARQAAVATSDAGSTVGQQRPSLGAGRALDVFV